MNFDKIKKSEDERQAAIQSDAQSIKQLSLLLHQEESLWKKATPAYIKCLNELVAEFAELLTIQGFSNKSGTKKDKCTMTYGEKEIIFEIVGERDFLIADITKGQRIPYQFVIEPKNLNLSHKHVAYLYSDKVSFHGNAKPNLQKEIQYITEYIEQLAVELGKLDSWKFKISPFDDTKYRFKQECFENIAEIINAID